jgi:hypothetical protein
MKHKEDKKKSLLLWAQQNVIDLTDRFQFGLPLLIVLEPLFDLGPHFGADAELFGDATGIADGKDPGRMAAAGGAFGATFLVPDSALKQRTTKNIGDGREVSGELQTAPQRLFVFHYS